MIPAGRKLTGDRWQQPHSILAHRRHDQMGRYVQIEESIRNEMILMQAGPSSRVVQHDTILDVIAQSPAVPWRHCSCFERAAVILSALSCGP